MPVCKHGCRCLMIAVSCVHAVMPPDDAMHVTVISAPQCRCAILLVMRCDTMPPLLVVTLISCPYLSVIFSSAVAAANLPYLTSLFYFIAFAGFIVRVPTLPIYLRSWAPNTSFARWALQGLIINEFKVMLHTVSSCAYSIKPSAAPKRRSINSEP